MAKSRKGAFVGIANRDYRPFPGPIGSRFCRMPNANFVELRYGEVQHSPDRARIAGVDEITHLSRRGVRRLLVYADTRDFTDRAVGRGLRASGRGRAKTAL